MCLRCSANAAQRYCSRAVFLNAVACSCLLGTPGMSDRVPSNVPGVGVVLIRVAYVAAGAEGGGSLQIVLNGSDDLRVVQQCPVIFFERRSHPVQERDRSPQTLVFVVDH